MSYGSIPLSLLTSAGGEGAEVIYALRNNDTLSKTVLNKIGDKGQITRKYYQRRLPSDMNKDYYYMLRNTPNAETIIVEYGFIDNIQDANRLRNNYKDYADAVIEAVLEYKSIPSEESDYYIVKKGDTLWSIAKNNNISVSNLKSLNNLTSNMLSIGQKLKLKEVYDNVIPEIPNTYVVEKGDTLYSIANKYNTTVDNLKKINNLIDNTLSIGQILLIGNNENTTIPDIYEYDNYAVKKGDTLYSIANKYNISVDELKNINNIETNILSIGQILKVPQFNNIYTVKKGDTLYSIAKNNNISIEKLKRINNLVNNTLTIGQQLLLS